MNKEKLMENWDELKDETKAQILALADKAIKEDYFVPKKGDLYYYLEHIGAPAEMPSERNCEGSDFDNNNIEIGNCYKDYGEAFSHGVCEFFIKRFEIYVNRHSEKLDWSDSLQAKHYVFYNSDVEEIYFIYSCVLKSQGTIYASDKQILKDAIADIGEENFLKYVMKIKKDKER